MQVELKVVSSDDDVEVSLSCRETEGTGGAEVCQVQSVPWGRWGQRFETQCLRQEVMWLHLWKWSDDDLLFSRGIQE